MPITGGYLSKYETWVKWIVPPGCTPRTNSEGFRRYGYEFTAKNAPESRPFPADPLQALTPQEYQFRRSSRGAARKYITEYACPHGGIHGPTYQETYVWDPYGASPWSTGLHPSDLWSGRLREKIDNMKVNLGTTLAEYRESARMFGNFATGVHTAWKVLRGKMPRKKLRVCSIPAAHLQYSYGIAPLVSDLYDTVEVLRLRLGLPVYKRFSVFNKHKLSGVDGVAECIDTWRSVRSQRAIFNVEFDTSSLSPISIGNPVEWAWELIPFSFVVDWGIPIGEWLHSLDALQGVNSVMGTVTTKDRYVCKQTVDADWHLIKSGYTRHSSHERTVHTSIPIPPPPSWDPSKSWRTIANGLALLGVLNKRCRR